MYATYPVLAASRLLPLNLTTAAAVAESKALLPRVSYRAGGIEMLCSMGLLAAICPHRTELPTPCPSPPTACRPAVPALAGNVPGDA